MVEGSGNSVLLVLWGWWLWKLLFTVPFLGLVLNLKLPSDVLVWSAFNRKIVFSIEGLSYHLDTFVYGSRRIPGLLGLV